METLHVADGQAFNLFGLRLPAWTGWLASIVVDELGNHVGADGTSQSISNELDLQLLLALRSKCSVIVTTGATARAEGYKSSRFAPIAFLTRDKTSLADVPAVSSPGAHPNIFLESSSINLDFDELAKVLHQHGHDKFLFEGGPALLKNLLETNHPIQLVLSIVDGQKAGEANLHRLNPKHFLNRVLGNDYHLELADDFTVGDNRITRWVKRAP